MELVHPIAVLEKEPKARFSEIEVDFSLTLQPKNLKRNFLELNLLEKESANSETLEMYVNENQNQIENYLCQ